MKKKNVKHGSNKKNNPVDDVDLSDLTDGPQITKFKQSEWNVAVSFAMIPPTTCFQSV